MLLVLLRCGISCGVNGIGCCGIVVVGGGGGRKVLVLAVVVVMLLVCQVYDAGRFSQE